ncbi:Ig-like domain-containing protein, partial [Pantoea sp. DY-5]
VAPEIPVLVDFYDNVGTPGAVIPDGEKAKTDDTTPTLRGTGTPNSIVHIQSAKTGDSWGDLGTARVDNNGNWEYTPATLDYATWQFRVKASNALGDTAWAQKVYLNIVKGGNYSTTIDFEESFGNVDLDSMTYGRWYETTNEINFQLYNSNKTNHKIPFITPGALVPEFGGKAVEMSQGDGVGIYKSDLFNRDSIAHNFSFQIYNPNQADVLMILVVRFRSETTVGNQVNKILTTKPGLNTFTNEDIFSNAEYPELYAICEFVLYNTKDSTLIGANPPLWFDNLMLEPPYWETSSLLSQGNDINNHQISGVEELSDNMVGHENQADILKITDKDQLLDLTTQESKIESIEIFDITGTGDNTLKLDLNALLQHGEKGLFIEDGKTQLMVKGNEGDVVELKDILPEGSDISEWQH